MTLLSVLRQLSITVGAALLLVATATAATAPSTVRIHVDAQATGTPFPHFWETTFGSGRASLALRDDYRKDLDAVREATGFSHIRFHGIFDRDVGLVNRGPDGSIRYNFSYVDQIYDGLLAHHVKPFVELSFMPPALSSDPKALQEFWYHPNIAPPKSYAEWDAMIAAFAKHLVARYGIDEVASWYFEVWNEPNIGFWAGQPKQPTYFNLYDHTHSVAQQPALVQVVHQRAERHVEHRSDQVAIATDRAEGLRSVDVPGDFIEHGLEHV